MKQIVPLILALILLTACIGASPSITGEWKLVSYGDPNNPTPALPNVSTSIKFDSNDQISGNIGCNGFGGNYKMDGGSITFSALMSTKMFCEETSPQEQAVLGVFSDQIELPIQMNAETLTITSADGSSVVTLARK
jgi:heat shock protein HslJ